MSESLEQKWERAPIEEKCQFIKYLLKTKNITLLKEMIDREYWMRELLRISKTEVDSPGLGGG